MRKVRVVVFGLGRIYQSFIKLVDNAKVEIIAVSDNNNEILKKVDQKTITPEGIKDLDFDYIIVTCNFYGEIKKQLKEYGIQEDCILNFSHIYKSVIIKNEQELKLMELLQEHIALSPVAEWEFNQIKHLEEKNLFLSAKIFICQQQYKKIKSLEEVEFKGYSQFGEDGIIQWLIHNVDIDKKTFIEFGTGNYFESNTRFLMMNNNWSGFVMDGNNKSIEKLKQWEDIWKYDLTARAAYITKDNINQLILDAGYSGDIGILSIDLDGVDYWILSAINCVSPRILICEYNNIFGAEKMVTVPYDETFDRTKAHYSWLYWGASISAFRNWAEKNNYYYVGSNSAGHNAFFVRKDCIEKDKIPLYADKFVECKYSESRGENGQLTHKRGNEALKDIKEMRVINLETNSEDTIENIYQI